MKCENASAEEDTYTRKGATDMVDASKGCGADTARSHSGAIAVGSSAVRSGNKGGRSGSSCVVLCSERAHSCVVFCSERAHSCIAFCSERP